MKIKSKNYYGYQSSNESSSHGGRKMREYCVLELIVANEFWLELVVKRQLTNGRQNSAQYSDPQACVQGAKALLSIYLIQSRETIPIISSTFDRQLRIVLHSYVANVCWCALLVIKIKWQLIMIIIDMHMFRFCQ